MLPLAVVLLAVAVFLLSVGTLTWMYIQMIRQMSQDDHKGSYKPYKMEERILGKSARLINVSTKASASDETDAEAGRGSNTDSDVVLLSVTPLNPEGESAQQASATQFDEFDSADDGYSPGNLPTTSAEGDSVSTCHSTSPRTQRVSTARTLTYDSSPESGAIQCHHKQLETSCTGVPGCQATCLHKTATDGASITKTGVEYHSESGNESGERSLSPMLWDYAGFKWPVKNREDVFTTDEYGHTDSDYSGTNDDEEDSDGHSSTSGVHRGLRKMQRSYSCYSFVEHCPVHLQNHRFVQLVPPECAVLHCGATSTGSLLVSDEDEADQGFFGKAQHDETYREYLESIISKRKARMYYGQYSHCPQS